MYTLAPRRCPSISFFSVAAEDVATWNAPDLPICSTFSPTTFFASPANEEEDTNNRSLGLQGNMVLKR